jgi:hypothetical protein
MPNRVCRWVAITTFSLVACSPLLTAQETSQHDLYAPLTNSDGLRYPLEIGPLTLHVVGSGIFPVKGSDGLIHLAYALQVTNAWSLTATIKSVEVVDPARGNQVSGNNRVLDVKNEDVTGQVKLFTLPGTMNKESYTNQIPSGQSGVMFFDITYNDISQVPKVIAHRITATTPPTPIGTEHTAIGHSIPVGGEAIVLSPPLKGSGWLNGNGCCLEGRPASIRH